MVFGSLNITKVNHIFRVMWKYLIIGFIFIAIFYFLNLLKSLNILLEHTCSWICLHICTVCFIEITTWLIVSNNHEVVPSISYKWTCAYAYSFCITPNILCKMPSCSGSSSFSWACCKVPVFNLVIPRCGGLFAISFV